jgi:hypothetical protein
MRLRLERLGALLFKTFLKTALKTIRFGLLLKHVLMTNGSSALALPKFLNILILLLEASLVIGASNIFGSYGISFLELLHRLKLYPSEHGAPHDRSRAVDVVIQNAPEYSMDQYASKVVEKCLKVGGNEFLDRYLDRVCEGRPDRPRIPLIDSIVPPLWLMVVLTTF